MRVHYLQHVPFEGLGSIEAWLRSAGCRVTHSRLYESVDFPDVDALDWLIVMGGPMSVNDEGRYPWLRREKDFIRSALAEGKRALGICLGAQLIASSLGARVYPNASKEIGWFPIRATAPSDTPTFQFPRELTAFHWHGETFDLPDHAVLLASSEGCVHQAFQLGKNVIGLQFHLETTPESARAIVSHCRDELSPSRYIQSESEILATPPAGYQSINDVMARVLTYLHEQG